jgi:glycosyltransferase involved in cell wall biosynthesis
MPPETTSSPTWHRDRGKVKRGPTSASPETPLPWRQRWKEDLLVQRDRFLEEYDLADLLLVLSEKAAETFRVQGFSEEKLFYLPRGVDVDRFTPGVRPPNFRAVFSGALIERKGVHHLLEAWHRLDLKDAELWLVGAVHAEMKPFLEKFAHQNVNVIGFAQEPEKYLGWAIPSPNGRHVAIWESSSSSNAWLLEDF